MRISDLSPELCQNSDESMPLILEELEDLVKIFERLSPEQVASEKPSINLLKSSSRLSSLLPLPESRKLQVWKLSYRLWNACVDLSNIVQIRSGEQTNGILYQKADEEQAKIRQIAADMIFIAGNASGIPSPTFKVVSFFYKTGLIWHDLKKFDVAEICFEKATSLTSRIEIERITDRDEQKLLLDLNLARARTLWEASETSLAITLLNRSRKFLFADPENFKDLSAQFLRFGKCILTKEQGSSKEAMALLNATLDLCDKGLNSCKKSEETLALENLKVKSLRFLAAAHLQCNEFDSVLKCVKVLRDSSTTFRDHASVPFLAMKAWLGIGKYTEAEKELKGMISDKKIPDTVCISAAEAYFQAAGTMEMETGKAVFLGMLARCHMSSSSALRVLQRICTGDGSRIRAKIVAELASDDRVITLFARGKDGAKERTAMHAILWNRLVLSIFKSNC